MNKFKFTTYTCPRCGNGNVLDAKDSKGKTDCLICGYFGDTKEFKRTVRF